MQGSTVTYSVVSDNGYCFTSGVRIVSANISSMASSSACRVAWAQDMKGISLDRKARAGTYVAQLIGSVPCLCNYPSIPDEHTSYWNFTCSERFLGLQKRVLRVAYLTKNIEVVSYHIHRHPHPVQMIRLEVRTRFI